MCNHTTCIFLSGLSRIIASGNTVRADRVGSLLRLHVNRRDVYCLPDNTHPGIPFIPRVYESAGVLGFTKYYGQIPCALLGLERHGKRAGEYSMFGGSADPADNHCWCQTASRELYEESGQTLSIAPDAFDGMPLLLVNGTPVFCARMDGLSRRPITENLTALYRNHAPHVFTEMVDVQFIELATNAMLDSRDHGRTFTRTPTRVSSYASTALRMLAMCPFV